ncbi:MAG: flavin reductase family protein [Planctomycetia bacterium]|nr:flavin reductase family protein [Planctomycetia bacterium]
MSIDRAHELSNGAIREHGELSASLITRELLTAADYCGIAKGAMVDKSTVFPCMFGTLPYAPIPTNAPLTTACRVVDSIDVKSFTNYVLKPEQTCVQEDYLDADGKVDYEKRSPVLFDMSKGRYFALGEVFGGAWKLGRDYHAQ